MFLCRILLYVHDDNHFMSSLVELLKGPYGCSASISRHLSQPGTKVLEP